MKRLLVICPTRERPNRLAEMVESFKINTSDQATLVTIVDDDDPLVKEYIDLSKKLQFICRVRPRKTVIEHLNWTFFCSSNYSYYSSSSDDYIYKTLDWDKKLTKAIDGNGIAYGNDLCAGENIPTTSIISGEIVRALNWLQLPTLTHLCGDLVYKSIGKRLKCLHYCPDVIIEHNHFMNRKAEKDASYCRTNSKEMYLKDHEAYEHWLKNNFDDDCERIKEWITR